MKYGGKFASRWRAKSPDALCAVLPYDYLKRKKKPWKYQPLADAMLKIHAADEENADYGRIRMFQALQYQKEIGKLGEVTIPSEGTVRKIMEQINLIHRPQRNHQSRSGSP